MQCVLDILYASGHAMLLTQIRSFLTGTRPSRPPVDDQPHAADHQDLEIDITLSTPASSSASSILQGSQGPLTSGSSQAAGSAQKPQAPGPDKPVKRRKRAVKNAVAAAKPRSASFSNFRGADWVLPGSPEAPKNLVLNSLNSFSGQA